MPNDAPETLVRLVLDTNTVVSGLLWDNAPSKLLDAALEGRVALFTTHALLFELADVLPRAKFASAWPHPSSRTSTAPRESGFGKL